MNLPLIITCDNLAWLFAFFACLFLLLVFLMSFGFLQSGQHFIVDLGWVRFKLIVPKARSVFLASALSGTIGIAMLCENPESIASVAYVDQLFVSSHEQEKRTNYCGSTCCVFPLPLNLKRTNFDFLPDRYNYTFLAGSYAIKNAKATVSFEFIGKSSSLMSKEHELTSLVNENTYLSSSYYTRVASEVVIPFQLQQINIKVCQGEWAAAIRGLEIVAVNQPKRCFPICKK